MSHVNGQLSVTTQLSGNKKVIRDSGHNVNGKEDV